MTPPSTRAAQTLSHRVAQVSEFYPMERLNELNPNHDRLDLSNSTLISIMIGLYGYIYIILFILDLVFWEPWYNSSLSLTKYLRGIPENADPKTYVWPKSEAMNIFKEYYAYFFANIMYKWAPAILPFSIIGLARKELGLAYVCLYFYNSVIRLLMMVTYRDRRPCWDLSYQGIKCKCGFGKPSGHASNSTMLWGIIMYQLVWVRARDNRKGFWSTWVKVLSVLLYYYIIISILWSRLYYGAHTFMQVLLGHFMSFLFLLIFIKFEREVSRFFYRVLTKQAANLKFTILTFILLCLTLLIWIINHIAYDRPAKNERTPARCTKCFSGIDAYGNKNLFALAYVVAPFAISLALYIRGCWRLQGPPFEFVRDPMFIARQDPKYRSKLEDGTEQGALRTKKLYKYVYNPLHNNPTRTRGCCSLLIRALMRMVLYIIPALLYVVSVSIPWKNPFLRTLVDYSTLFVGFFLGNLLMFDVMKFVGIYNPGEIVNLDMEFLEKVELENKDSSDPRLMSRMREQARYDTNS